MSLLNKIYIICDEYCGLILSIIRLKNNVLNKPKFYTHGKKKGN